MIYLLFKCTRHTCDTTHAHTRAPIFLLFRINIIAWRLPCRSYIARLCRCESVCALKFLSFFLFYIHFVRIHENTYRQYMGTAVRTYTMHITLSKPYFKDQLTWYAIQSSLASCSCVGWCYSLLFNVVIVFVAVVCLCVWLFLNIAQHAEGSISVVVLNVQLYFGPETVKTYTVVSNFVDNFLIWFSLNSL